VQIVENGVTLRRNRLYYILPFAVIVLAYLAAVYAIPPESSTLTKYSLTPSQARVLSLSIVVPIVIIWSFGLSGLIKFREYAEKISKDRDGQAFMKISAGLAVLVYGLPLSSLISTAVNYFTRENPDLIPSGTILVNYVALGVMILSFYIIHKGARLLVSNIKQTPVSAHYRVWQLLFGLLSVLLVYSTLKNPARSVPTEGVVKAVYYLPDWLIVSTVIIPYILAWYLGFQAVYYLRHYRNKVPGVLYKSSLGYISNGIAAVVLASIVQRFLTTQTVYFSNQSLQVLLFIILLLLIVISVGYILIAIGSNKLRKIEEV
jgi:hypothetical protein